MTDALESPLVRFADAEQRNPFRLLLDLYDRTVGGPAAASREDILAEQALAAAVVSWWSRWQPASIHAAFRAGANLADIAAATGLEPAEVVRRWQRWTDVQTRLIIGGRPAVDIEEIRTIRRRLRAEAAR
ncbi:hypothetical protein Drose_27100 [Dactylosporangium roseum]|uniref:Uncharacterized protein n=1 Tax=Dactylosporangium roseum TaxID=47989 RepID=A0ABY5Z059_9ACTN|nr:hypothetical protein [Dactylosporangium roseum]UWZ34837.1 hypothetical protein Drose_27100 [Dactylosporangium roseum]